MLVSAFVSLSYTRVEYFTCSLNDANRNCLAPPSGWDTTERIAESRAGAVYNLNEQCRFRYGSDSNHCGDVSTS